MQDIQTKLNGPVAAAFVAAGLGSAAVGLFLILAEINADVKSFLDFSKNFGLGSGVGPLSGKIALATLTFLISWGILHLVTRGNEVNFGRWFAVALVLVFLGFALTFPPIFEAIIGIFVPAA